MFGSLVAWETNLVLDNRSAGEDTQVMCNSMCWSITLWRNPEEESILIIKRNNPDLVNRICVYKFFWALKLNENKCIFINNIYYIVQFTSILSCNCILEKYWGTNPEQSF